MVEATLVGDDGVDLQLLVGPSGYNPFVLELRPAGTDKGGALRAVVDEVGAEAVATGGSV